MKTLTPILIAAHLALGAPASEQQDFQEAAGQIGISDWNWSKDDFTHIMTVHLTITNHSRWNIKDIKLRAQHAAPSGTVIDSNLRTLYQSVPAGSSITLTQNMGFMHPQSKESSLSIQSFKLDGPPKYTLEQLEQSRQAAADRQAATATAAKSAAQKKKADQAAAVLKHHQSLASKGDAYGQFKMGVRHATGDGVPKDMAEARRLLGLASAQGRQEARDYLKTFD